MAEQPVTVSKISWRDIFPALIIFRSLSITLTASILMLATAGLLVSSLGWVIADAVFVTEEMGSENQSGALSAVFAEVNSSPYGWVYPLGGEEQSLVKVLGNQVRGIELAFHSYVYPVGNLFRKDLGFRWFCYFFLGSVWMIATWCYFGCAICRIAMMQLTREESIGITDGLRYATGRFLSCFTSVTLPLGFVIVLTIPLAILGLIMATNLGAAFGGLIWFLVLIESIIIAILLIGLAFGWPLMISAISAEGLDAFDGTCRALAYVLQRPIQYFVYAIIAIVFSGFCWLIVSFFVQSVIEISAWTVSWGSDVSENRAAILVGEMDPPAVDEDGAEISQSSMLSFGRSMISFWNGLVRTVGAAFLYGMFWVISSSMYLLLRKDLDDTEMDEIYLEEDHRTFELPPLKDGEDGVPEMTEDDELPAKVEPPEDE